VFRAPWESFFCQMFSARFVDDSGEAQSYSTPTEITAEQQKECAHLGHAEGAGRSEQPKQ
jgi:hypothetical protein